METSFYEGQRCLLVDPEIRLQNSCKYSLSLTEPVLKKLDKVRLSCGIIKLWKIFHMRITWGNPVSKIAQKCEPCSYNEHPRASSKNHNSLLRTEGEEGWGLQPLKKRNVKRAAKPGPIRRQHFGGFSMLQSLFLTMLIPTIDLINAPGLRE